jgi:hypothetical protein
MIRCFVVENLETKFRLPFAIYCLVFTCNVPKIRAASSRVTGDESFIGIWKPGIKDLQLNGQTVT